MYREFMKSKIHRATVTEANLNYIGSITIDEVLMEAVDLLEYEKVSVLDICNGNRLDTYVIKGERNSGEICINGAAAHLIQEGDLVIILSFCQLSEPEIENFKPQIIHVNGDNKIIDPPSESDIIKNC